MAGQKVSKIEIKKYLREKLQCDYGFIIHLTKWGMIQKLQDAYADPVEPDAYAKETLDEIYETYKDYCETWGLDYEADNRKNKDYLRDCDAQKRIVIPPLTEERKSELLKTMKKKRK